MEGSEDLGRKWLARFSLGGCKGKMVGREMRVEAWNRRCVYASGICHEAELGAFTIACWGLRKCPWRR